MVKFLVALVFGAWGCLSALTSFAAPFAEWFPGTSPKGVQVRVWGEGDEYSIRYEAEDGHAVVKDLATRTYFYARQNADGALVSTGIAVGDETDADRVTLATIPLHQRDTSAAAREARQKRIDRDESETDRLARWAKQKETMRKLREAKKSGLLMAPPDNPTSGTVKGLTVLIDFPITGSEETTWSSVHPNVTVAQLTALLNGENCTLYGNASSVRSYYLDVSNGRLDYSMAVIGPILAPKPRTYYDDPERDNGECARELMGDIFKIIKADTDFSTKYLPLFQSLSTLNGKVRSLNFWFAGESATEWSYGLWAHKWSVSSTFASTYAFTVGDKTVKFENYQITPILKSPGVYTFCHENGHMLCGFPDLYNYEESVSGNRGVGYFSLMYGSADRSNPPFIDPYLRTAAGWLEPKLLPSAGGTVTVRNNHTDVWKYENPSNPLEYYLIENRQQTGRDASIPASGVLIWRCNEAGSNTHPKPVAELSGFVTGVHRWPYELSLEQADGKYDLEQNANTGDAYDAWYSGNTAYKSSGKFNDSSFPTAKWANADDSGLSLSGFSSKGETMTFTVASYSGAAATVPLADALDAAELEFSTSAKLGWFGQTTTANAGGSAAKSGSIGDSQSTWMQTVVTGPGTLSFAWMVSSERSYDYLEFAIDGQTQEKISGSQSWATKTYSIPEGQHAVSWTYRKDISTSSGDDAGYVDHVVWTPDPKVAKPVISGPSGADFLPPATVSVTCATAGATIRYTLDGTDPTEMSAVYTQPIVIERDTEIRVRAFKGWPAGVKYTAKKIAATGMSPEIPAFSIYGTPTKAGVFIVTATTKEKEQFFLAFTVWPSREEREFRYVSQAYVAIATNLGAQVTAASGLPSGLKFKSGDVSGTPTKPGVYAVTLTKQDKSKEIVLWKVTNGENPGLGAEDIGWQTGNVAWESETMTATAQQGASLDLDVSLEALDPKAKVTVSGLPSGLKYDAKKGKITGVATKVEKKVVVVKVVQNGITVTKRFALSVLDNPFAGVYRGWAQTERATGDVRLAAFETTIGVNGKVSIAYTEGKSKYSTSAKSYDYDLDSATGTVKPLTFKASSNDKKAGLDDRRVELRLCGHDALFRTVQVFIDDVLAGTGYGTVKTLDEGVILPALQTLVLTNGIAPLATLSVAWDAKKATASYAGRLFDGTAIKMSVPVCRQAAESDETDYVFAPFQVVAKDKTVYLVADGSVGWVAEDDLQTVDAEAVICEQGDKKFAELVPEEGVFTFGWGNDAETVSADEEVFRFEVTMDTKGNPKGVAIYDVDPQVGEKPLATVTAKVGKTTGAISASFTSKKGDKAKYAVELVWQGEEFFAGHVTRTWKDGKVSYIAYGTATVGASASL